MPREFALLITIFFVTLINCSPSYAITPKKCASLLELEVDPIWTGSMPAIKKQVQTVWLRKKSSYRFTQSQAAAAVGITQGGFSKVMWNDGSHPWTAEKLLKFAAFTRSSIFELLPEELISRMDDSQIQNVPGPFDSTFEDSDRTFRDECIEAVKTFYLANGINLPPKTAEQLGTSVFESLHDMRISKEKLDKAVMLAILKRALN